MPGASCFVWYDVTYMAEQSKKWARAQKRPRGTGVKVYIDGATLAQAFEGPVPDTIDYRVLVDDEFFNSVVVDLKGVSPDA